MTGNDNRPKNLTDESLRMMLDAKERINRRLPREITIGGKKYKVRQISKAVRRRIHHLELEAFLLSGKQKEAQTIKEAKRVNDSLDRLHAKTAAYYLLGNMALWLPWIFSLTWRKIMRRPEEVSAQINAAAINQEEINFSLANWQITEQQLALSMKPIGEGVKQTLKRMERLFAAGRRGRYEEKGGGQFVNSFTIEATENEKIKAVYGNYNLWSWLRYWYLDTENYVTWMLYDKGFHDYDYTEPKETKPKKKTNTALWSADRMSKIFSKAVNPNTGKSLFDAEEGDAGRIQSEILADKS